MENWPGIDDLPIDMVIFHIPVGLQEGNIYQYVKDTKHTHR